MKLFGVFSFAVLLTPCFGLQCLFCENKACYVDTVKDCQEGNTKILSDDDVYWCFSAVMTSKVDVPKKEKLLRFDGLIVSRGCTTRKEQEKMGISDLSYHEKDDEHEAGIAYFCDKDFCNNGTLEDYRYSYTPCFNTHYKYVRDTDDSRGCGKINSISLVTCIITGFLSLAYLLPFWLVH